MLQITECSIGSTKFALFTWTNFTHGHLKLASFGNSCMVWPVLFELLQNWITQRFTIMKMWALFEKKLRKHTLISQRVHERHLASGNQRSTRDIICKIAQFKMAEVKNFEAIFQCKNWLSEQKIHRLGTCHVCTKRLWGPQNSIFGVYMPFN